MILSVFEHQWLKKADFACPSDFDWLIDQEFSVMSVSRRQGQWQLLTRQYIGVVCLPSGNLLEILPKVTGALSPNTSELNTLTPSDNHSPQSQSRQIGEARAWLQQMLSDISGFSQIDLSPKSLNQASHQLQSAELTASSTLPLSDWLYQEFARLLAQYTPIQQYVSHQQNSSQLRGKLILSEQLRRNAHLPHRFFSEHQSLARDSISNRLITKAWQQLLTLYTHDSHNPVHHSPSQLQNTLGISASSSIRQWSQMPALTNHEMSQMNQSYHQAQKELRAAMISAEQRRLGKQILSLAYWILAARTAPPGFGVHLAADTNNISSVNLARHCLFINMNHAFEAWSSAKVSQLYQTDSRYQVQYQAAKPWAFTENHQPCVTVTPDILINFEHKPHHIAEVKYKRIANIAQLSARDVYQLAAYADAYRVGEAWLIYPISSSQAALPPSTHTASLSITLANAQVLKIYLVPLWVEAGQLMIENILVY
ncbi:MAG: hypothetical protein Q4P13_02190 [Psychrobacter sp.]|nr:hypothetical protein [Psychrobacter sp.]